VDVDKTEELQRSIDAVLARIEAQKRALGSLLGEGRPGTVFGLRRAVSPMGAAGAETDARVRRIPQ
jgi:hypothetical protein